MDTQAWWAYMKGYIATSLADDTISVSDMTVKILGFKESPDNQLSESEFCVILSSVLDLKNRTKALDLINQITAQRPQYKKGLFSTRMGLLQQIETDPGAITAEVAAYESEFGKDVTSTSTLLTNYLKDGYEKNEMQIKQLLRNMESYMR
jgi:hypothetical protein